MLGRGRRLQLRPAIEARRVTGISQKPVRRLYSARGAGLFATAHFSYFGMIVWFPPGEPGGGITGMVAAPRCGGCTVIPGSTFVGGLIVPFCCDS
jgi:hypothetical protein